MNENNSNVFKPKAAGPIVAAIALILVIALVVVLVSVIAAASSKEEPSVTTTTVTTTNDPSTTTTASTTTSNKEQGDDPITRPEDEGTNKEEQKPTINYIGVDSTDIYKGNLLFIDTETNYYRFDKELLITKAEMAKLTEAKLLEVYNFTNIYGKSGGNFKVKSDNGFYLDVETLEAFGQMMAAYATESGNKDVQVRNAYYYIEGDLPLNATGKVVDLEINKSNGTYPLNHTRYKAEYYNWFIQNCGKYGFVHVEDQTNYSKFRYVGTPHAQYMSEHELDLESYLNLICGYRFENRLIYNDGASEWWIYYVPGSGEETQVPVAGSNYSISGNNIDGFVVAINASKLANG